MRKYETIYIVKPDLGDEELQVFTDKVKDIISSEGELLRLEDWGVRKLAYSIKKFPRGRYVYLRYDGSEKLVAEFERRLRIDDRVLRYLSVKIDKEVPVSTEIEIPAEADAADAVETGEETE